MEQKKHNSYYKVAACLAGLALSGLSNATPLLNGDFSSGFNNWQGEVVSSGIVNPLPGGFPTIFDSSTGAAVLTADAIEWSVKLFQTFDLSINTQTLSFNFSQQADDINDTWFAQLVDLSDASHFLTLSPSGPSGTSQFNLTGFNGLTVQLLFGLENIAGQNDVLTIDNIKIEEQPNGSVPEPNMLLLFCAGFLALFRRIYSQT